MRNRKRLRLDFRKPKQQIEFWYDMEKDAVLIEQSIAKQYGIIPSEQEELKYSDWAKLVSGLMEDTPLGRIVSIRSETDREAIRKFTSEQKKVYNDWQRFRSRKIMSDPEFFRSYEEQMKALERSFAAAFGKKGGG